MNTETLEEVSLNTGLSTQALVWMIARIQALTGLEFDLNAVAAIAKQVDVDSEVYDSTVGWPLDHLWPHFRRVLSPDENCAYNG